MIDDKTFTKEDTALYTSWEPGSGVITLHIPGIGDIKMTLSKANEISADIARQVDYGRWYAMEVRHDESQKKPSA